MLGFDTYTCVPPSVRDIKKASGLLQQTGLRYEGKPDVTVIIEDGDGNIAATASLEGCVIKMVAASPAWHDSGLGACAVSAVVTWAHAHDRHHLFIYTTSPEKFENIGFCELARTGDVALLEMGEPSADSFMKDLKAINTGKSPAGAIVMNANPFTLGHRFLVEHAAGACGQLYVIVVEEEKSVFSYEHRLAMVCAGTADTGAVVLGSGPYAVSAATFPSYFMRDAQDTEISLTQGRLDAELFCSLFVPGLGITRRYVGTEPLCGVTCTYNRCLEEVLPAHGVELCILPRAGGDTPISASRVRELIRASRDVSALLPESTQAYLASHSYLLDAVKNSNSPH